MGDKMIKPRYQDYQARDIPTVPAGEGGDVRVMAGEFSGTKGPIELRNPGLLLDVRLAPGGSKFQHAFPKHWNAFAYVYEGAGSLCGSKAKAEHAVVFEQGGDHLEAVSAADKGFKFLLIAGQPIGESI